MDEKRPDIISSRVRLVRNLDGYPFPSRLSEEDSRELIGRLEYGFKDMGELYGEQYEYAYLEELKDLDRQALRERRILNSTIEKKKSPTGIILSEDESSSLILNGEDHIRLQLISPGLCLEELWKKADCMDDYMNERFAYAFDEKYGYLTSYPTNVGTGLRASVMLHLPSLSQGKKFNSLLGDIGRFGTTVKGVYGEGSETLGSLYVVSNQRTLGQSEEEIIDLVSRAALQLYEGERQVRQLSLEKHRLERTDEAYKSYGMLKYARRLTKKDAMMLLSHVMAGMADGLLQTETTCSVYRLMLGIQTANLQKLSDRPLGREELDQARAAYLRIELPELKQ